MRQLYTYVPEFPMACGELGEHVPQFTAEIEAQQNRFGWSYGVKILKVALEVKFEDEKPVILDVTKAILKLPRMREMYEEEIRQDYLKTLNSSAV